jgi:tRNA threonylcarbamoyladenosine biosynthesis protein TsaE
MERIEFISTSASETIALGEHIGRFSERGDLFLLYGELGAGKTQLVKGMAKGMDVAGWQYVVSPSFTLMNIYEGRVTLCHVDLYRIEAGEVEGLNIEEYLDSGIVAIEWAEKFTWGEGAIPVHLAVAGEDKRKIVLEVEDAGRAEVWRNFSRES